MRGFLVFVLLFLALAAGFSDTLATDAWSEPAETAVVVNNDCGVVSGIWGGATIKGQFMTAKERGAAVDLFDRVNAGDEIETSGNAKLEFSTGNNLVSLVGPNSKIKIIGVRTFLDSAGKPATRLVIKLLQGSLRVQARLNSENPESVMVDAGGVLVLVTRGDAFVSNDKGWKIAAMAGEVLHRTPNGQPSGLNAGETIAQNNSVESLSGKEMAAMMTALPFSFEIRRAALPPTPPPDPSAEAP